VEDTGLKQLPVFGVAIRIWGLAPGCVSKYGQGLPWLAIKSINTFCLENRIGVPGPNAYFYCMNFHLFLEKLKINNSMESIPENPTDPFLTGENELRAENEVLKLKLKMEYGMDIHQKSSLPPVVEN
jgi:hypothetical protein